MDSFTGSSSPGSSGMSMRRILLPEPPPPFAAAAAVPEIFGKGQQSAVVSRAVIIGNGQPGAESQSLGLVRALGLGSAVSLHRVVRPPGLLNSYLRFLPVAVHKQVDRYLVRTLAALAKLAAALLRWLRRWRTGGRGQARRVDTADLVPFSPAHRWLDGRGEEESDPVLQAQPLLSLVPPPVEADASSIASSAQRPLQGDRESGPLLVVACGRDTVSVAAELKKLAGTAAFVVQIQEPRGNPGVFDLVVSPEHDFFALTPRGQKEIHKWLRPFLTPQPPHRNVILTTGALNLADAALLRSSAVAWHGELGSLPKPLVVVNIGGPTRHCPYDTKLLASLARTLRQLQEACGGSFRVSYSRRTPPHMRLFLSDQLEGYPGVHIWNGDGPNPHFGHLAWGDAFVVTADSVSMLSEACSTGKPVYVVGREYCQWKLAEFHRTLERRGAVRQLTPAQDMSEFWSYPPLRDNADVAARVRTELAKRGFII